MTYTYPAFLTAIANGEMNPDLQAAATELLEKHTKAAESRNSKQLQGR